jgi:hypothetical protein
MMFSTHWQQNKAYKCWHITLILAFLIPIICLIPSAVKLNNSQMAKESCQITAKRMSVYNCCTESKCDNTTVNHRIEYDLLVPGPSNQMIIRTECGTHIAKYHCCKNYDCDFIDLNFDDQCPIIITHNLTDYDLVKLGDHVDCWIDQQNLPHIVDENMYTVKNMMIELSPLLMMWILCVFHLLYTCICFGRSKISKNSANIQYNETVDG